MKNLIIVFTLFLITISCSNKKEEMEIPKEPEVVLNEYNFISDTLIEQPGVVLKNEVFSDILLPFMSYSEILNLVNITRDVFDVRTIKPDQQYIAYVSNDSTNKLLHFVYEIDKVQFVHYSFMDSIPSVTINEKEIRRVEKMVGGEIGESLWATMLNLNVSPVLAIKMSEILAWSIDFNAVRVGDKFKAIYDDAYVGDEYWGIGKVKAIYFEHMNEPFYAFRFVQGNDEEYFDEEGGSLRKAFLKAPLKFTRISSRYTNSRFHPILRIYRPHRGIDYAAPIGTEVHAVGDGKIISARRKGGAGNYVKIKHNSIYSSGYMHLSRFGKGIKEGKFVKQGDIIGYVGSTGLSTGPHLDFRFWENGSLVNYITQKFPPTKPVKSEYKQEYFAMRDSINQILDEIQIQNIQSEVTRNKSEEKKEN